MVELTPVWRIKNRHFYCGCNTEMLRGKCKDTPVAIPKIVPDDVQKNGCIYLFLSKATARAYVGQSKNVWQRLKSHKSALRGGRHHSTKLQNEWNTFGESGFLFVVVEQQVDPIYLHCREQFWMWRFGERLLNASESAHPDRSGGIRQKNLQTYSDQELLVELHRRGLVRLEEGG